MSDRRNNGRSGSHCPLNGWISFANHFDPTSQLRPETGTSACRPRTPTTGSRGDVLGRAPSKVPAGPSRVMRRRKVSRPTKTLPTSCRSLVEQDTFSAPVRHASASFASFLQVESTVKFKSSLGSEYAGTCGPVDQNYSKF
jgi:hypothetical protein